MGIRLSVAIGMCSEVIFGENGRVLMLCQSALKIDEVVGPQVGISSKPGVDACTFM
jgi:hypothetical protein